MNVGLLSSVSALAIVGYTGVVIYNGNLIALLAALKGDWRFLEFLVAIGAIYYVAKIPYLTGPVLTLVGIAVIAMLLKAFSGTTGQNLKVVFNSFAAGDLGLFDTFIAAGTQFGKGLGLQPLYQSSGNVIQFPGVKTP